MSDPLPLMQPIIGVAACRRVVETFHVHWSPEKYVAAAARGADGIPVIVPALGARELSAGFADDLVGRLDGLLLTGSPSNVEPHHYGADPFDGDWSDPDRDATTLPLIRAALAADLPILALCRGIQELNVALGGSLFQKLHEMPGRMDHRSDKTLPHQDRHGLRHSISITPGGKLAGILGSDADVVVNSLHAQAIDKPAPGVTIEAHANDGTVESITVDGAHFALGVQWHPEWEFWQDPTSAAIWNAFGTACRERASKRMLISPAAAAE
jgi:putative glutamine amidotransferase